MSSISVFLYYFFLLIYLMTKKFVANEIFCCAARGHALAIWHRYAPPRSARWPNALRAAQQNLLTFILQPHQ